MGSSAFDSFHVVSWNANGLKSKIDELRDYINEHAPDIVAVNETHLIGSEELNVRNYEAYFTNRPNLRHGGTAVYIKRSLRHTYAPLPALHTLEATAVDIPTSLGTIRVVAAYRSPRRTLTLPDLDSVLDTGIPTVLVGDLNTKHPHWNSRVSNHAGVVLNRYAVGKDFHITAPTEPTHFAFDGGRPDVLDIVVFAHLQVRYTIETAALFNSDHNPIFMDLDLRATTSPELPTKRVVNWDSFSNHLSESLGRPPIRISPDEVDRASVYITEKITESMEAASRVVPRKENHLRLPLHLRNLIRGKNRARKLWQATRSPVHRTEMNRLANHCRKEIKAFKTSKWESKIKSLNAEDSSIWRHIAIIKNPNKKNSCPPIHGLTGMALNDADKAEAIADSFERQFTPNDQPSNEANIAFVHEEVRKYLSFRPRCTLPLVSCEEVQAQIKNYKIKKASGPDSIPNQALKALPLKAIRFLTKIYNLAIQAAHFPSVWKLAYVHPILKPGEDPKFPQNYRPISLLSALGKLLEKIILNRLQDFLSAYNIISPCQFGFREKHATTHQLLRLVEKITDGFNVVSSTGIIFLDIARAFDRVWHQGLIFKLARIGAPSAIVHLVKSFLGDRSFQVRIGQSLSSPRPIRAGVPQGSILGPTLFSIFINDIPVSPGIELALYADDTAIAYTHRTNSVISSVLQESLVAMEIWFEDWRVKVNPAKTKAVLFTRRKNLDIAEVTLFNTPIPWSDSAPYLGVVLDRKLTFNPHTLHAVTKTSKALAMLNSQLISTSRLSLENKLLIYTSILRPMLTYGGCIWGCASKSTIQKVQQLQSKILRIITNAPWYVRNSIIHRDLKIQEINIFLRKLSEKFLEGLPGHPNTLITTLAAEDVSGSRFKHPRLWPAL